MLQIPGKYVTILFSRRQSQLTGFFYLSATEQPNIVVTQSPLFELPDRNPLLRLASPGRFSGTQAGDFVFLNSLQETPK